jgi:hypothetical protein
MKIGHGSNLGIQGLGNLGIEGILSLLIIDTGKVILP